MKKLILTITDSVLRGSFVALGCLVVAVGLHAVTGQAQTKTAAPSVPAVGATASAYLIICDSDPEKIIVLDESGKWLPTVKSADIQFAVGQKPKITCILYSGAFKPTNPTTKTSLLSEVKTVTATEFQGMIDSLQVDPSALRKNKVKPSNSGGTKTSLTKPRAKVQSKSRVRQVNADPASATTGQGKPLISDIVN